MEKKEPWLGSRHATEAVLKRHDIHVRKRYGQNFLTDAGVLGRIVRAAGITEDDFVIEIGPGIGTLTQYLSYAAGRVYAVEIDRDLIPVLTEDTLAGFGNVTVVNDDILKVDLQKLVNDENGGRPVKIAANLPYYITTPVLMEILEKGIPFESVTVMVQKEVADRMQAKPGTKDYGALSVAVQYYTVPEIAEIVPPECFVPRPNVSSAVICLKKRTGAEMVRAEDEKLMFSLVKAAFSKRRKTLYNCLRGSEDVGLTNEQAAAVIEAAGLKDNVRGEELSALEFVALSDAAGRILS